LERISELTELDLDDAENRLILHLALKIQRVLATIPGH
jgi:DNA-binding PucR family transcriptional regulator